MVERPSVVELVETTPNKLSATRRPCASATTVTGPPSSTSHATAARHAARSSATGSVSEAYSGSSASTPGTSTTRAPVEPAPR